MIVTHQPRDWADISALQPEGGGGLTWIGVSMNTSGDWLTSCLDMPSRLVMNALTCTILNKLLDGSSPTRLVKLSRERQGICNLGLFTAVNLAHASWIDSQLIVDSIAS